ncbi:MAG: (2Fe-2S)-binding protein [Thermodesulfobacteriota bacterium]|nr:(2Fe-2S)-binding protein [Thermodesulfobacteriota bacterium]
MNVQFKLNGRAIAEEAEPYETLLDFLRERLKVTSVKKGCDEGDCGACTILLNGKPLRSCLLLAVQMAEKDEVTTVEGLAKQGEVSEIQEAFVEKYGFQCGFCTPGMILTAKALLDENPRPTVEEIKDQFEGNLCRCTGYAQIIESVQRAAELQAGRR